MARLAVERIDKAFGATRALSDVSLSIEPGEVYAVLGENGAGKSTLMKILAGAERQDTGSMLLDGQAYRPERPIDARRRGVAVVWQEPELCADLSVAENVLLGMEPTRFGVIQRRVGHALVRRALAALGEHAARLELDALCRWLPPADQQLVAIARALVQSDCRLLILDEPTSRLAHHDVERLFTMVKRLAEKAISVVFVSHFLDEVRLIAGRFSVLRDGKLVTSGKLGDVTNDELVSLMAGRKVEHSFERSERTPGEPLLELNELRGSRLPLSATLELRKGEVLGIAGLVGSGRTELMRAIFGLDKVAGGTLKVAGFVGPASPARRMAQGVGMLSEDRKNEGLALKLSVADNLTLSKLTGFGPLGLILPERQARLTERFIERLRIRCRDHAQPTAELSGGNQQKVALGRLLYHDVDIFLLDEPTRGVDVSSRAEIYRLIDELAQRKKALIVVSSSLTELIEISDRIAVMRRGRLGPARPARELDEPSLLAEATGS